MEDHERAEAEDIIRAIRQGEVDAFVVREAAEERIYSLRSADVLYRAMIEEMKDGAVALDASRPHRLLQRVLRAAHEGRAHGDHRDEDLPVRARGRRRFLRRAARAGAQRDQPPRDRAAGDGWDDGAGSARR